MVFDKLKKLEIIKKFEKNINKIGINFAPIELINLNYVIIFEI
jgi:hypothetical protein